MKDRSITLKTVCPMDNIQQSWVLFPGTRRKRNCGSFCFRRQEKLRPLSVLSISQEPIFISVEFTFLLYSKEFRKMSLEEKWFVNIKRKKKSENANMKDILLKGAIVG